MFSASGKTREVIVLYLDPELKEYIDLKFNEFEEFIEMKCGYIDNYKKDTGSIKKILTVSRGIISSDVLEKYIKKLFPYSRYR